jgi:hypothetical protein
LSGAGCGTLESGWLGQVYEETVSKSKRLAKVLLINFVDKRNYSNFVILIAESNIPPDEGSSW